MAEQKKLPFPISNKSSGRQPDIIHYSDKCGPLCMPSPDGLSIFFDNCG